MILLNLACTYLFSYLVELKKQEKPCPISVPFKKFFFLHTSRKVRTVRPAGEKQPTHFTLLAFGSSNNYMRSETFFTFTP